MKLFLSACHFAVLLGVLILCLACNGQSSVQYQPVVGSGDQKITRLGKSVSEIDSGIMVMYQDKNQQYWFGGSEAGLYRFDGQGLTLFTVNDGLCSHAVIGIQEDRLGNLFFDTLSGVSKFDGNTFTTLEVVQGDAFQNEWKLEPDDLWFRMGWDNKGPYRYDGHALYALTFPKTKRGEEFYAKYPQVPFSPYAIYSMYKDSKGAMWFGTGSLGLCRFDGTSFSWLYEEQLTKTPAGGDFGIRALIEDRDGYFWISNPRYRFEILPDRSDTKENGLVAYRRQSGIGTAIQPNDRTDGDRKDSIYFLAVAEDHQGDLWMATFDDGVWRKSGHKLIHYPLQDRHLSTIYIDRQAGLWLGTRNAGVYRFNGKAFEKFLSGEPR